MPEPTAEPEPTADVTSIAEVIADLDLSTLTFEPGSSVFAPGASAALDDLGARLIDLPGVDLEIQGHTGSDGDPDVNLLLSDDRAQAVRNELIERMELDRLQLQARWRQAFPRAELCPSDAAPMLAAALKIETPPQLSRQVEPLRDGPGVRVVWSVPAQQGLVRSRWFTPAGLGLC